MLEIGKLKLKSNIILAPMAGITDLPFRLLCRKFGCELAFTEMINVRSLGYKSRKTQSMLFSDKKEKLLGVQILGCEPKFMLRALEILRQFKFDVLDFNAACPVKKVVRRGEGAALMCQPEKLSQLLKLVVDNSLWPVTLKIRTGWDRDSLNAVTIGRIAEDCGVRALFIHGRTKTQGYALTVDYQTIREVKKAVSIPVIGSGDIFSAELAKKMLRETDCDGIAVARGALGNPWIFQELSVLFNQKNTFNYPDIKERLSVMLQHLDMNIDFYGEKNGVILFRKFFSWYTKGFRHVRALREEVSQVKNKDDLVSIINKCQDLAVKQRDEF